MESAASGGGASALTASSTEKKSIKVLCSHCEKILVPIETEKEFSSLVQCIFIQKVKNFNIHVENLVKLNSALININGFQFSI